MGLQLYAQGPASLFPRLLGLSRLHLPQYVAVTSCSETRALSPFLFLFPVAGVKEKLSPKLRTLGHEGSAVSSGGSSDSEGGDEDLFCLFDQVHLCARVRVCML